MKIIGLDINISFSPCSKFGYLLLSTKRRCLSVLVACFLLLNTKELKAQESMIPDLSYPFLEKLIYSAKQNYPLTAANLRKVNFANYNLKKAKLSWFDFYSIGLL